MIEAVPADDLVEGIPKGTKPGRELSQHPAAVRARADRAAKREKLGGKAAPSRRPGKATPRRPSTRAASLKNELAAFLTLTNTLVIMSPLGTRPVAAIHDPNTPAERIGDELDAAEIDQLAAALDAQCRRSPRFRKYVESVLTVGAGGQLVTILGIIATRRAARHGIIPGGQPLDFALGMMIASGDASALGNFTPTGEPDTAPDAETLETPPDLTVPVAVAGDGGIDFDRL